MGDAGGYESYAFIADLYDYVVPYRSRPDVGFWVESAQEAGGPVLEVGCGTGRVLIPTARAGIEIVGLDLSPHMLDVCRSRLAEEPLAVRSKVQLVEGDMRRFDLGRSFNLVTAPFRAFQHLTTVEDQLECLASIRRHLIDGGLLVLDLFNPSLEALVNTPFGEEIGEEPEFSTPDGRRVVRRFNWSLGIGPNRSVRWSSFTTSPTPMAGKSGCSTHFPSDICFATRSSTCWRAAGSCCGTSMGIGTSVRSA